MLRPSTWQHLRIPFSLFLLPVFLFAFACQPLWSLPAALIFVILHLLVYPASNGYNSYFDKDEEAIGGVEKPLPVTKQLYWTALAFDGLALLLSLFISLPFAGMVLVYGLVSKAYSHPAIRLKKYPIAGWLVVGLVQGYFTWWMVWIGLHGGWPWQQPAVGHIPALLSSCLLWGSYPMTQIYQHAEDKRRGDRTLSLLLGIKGTFHFVILFFALSVSGFSYYFITYHNTLTLLVFYLSLLPVLGYFTYWYWLVSKNLQAADFHRTMQLNLLSSLCFILFFGIMIFLP